jgi:hypothetical protein
MSKVFRKDIDLVTKPVLSARDLFLKIAEAFGEIASKTSKKKQVFFRYNPLKRSAEKLIDEKCVRILKRIDAHLIREYEGAALAASGDNPDGTRHTFISLRTMWEHIQEVLAPVDKTMLWLLETKRVGEAYVYTKDAKRRPTTFARFTYMFRDLLGDDFSDYCNQVVKALKSFVGYLNKVHSHLLVMAKSRLQKIFRMGNGNIHHLEPVVC